MNKIFLVGIVVGLVSAIALAGLFSILAFQSTAQMMGGNNMAMMGNQGMNGHTMSMNQGVPAPLYWKSMGSFSANGISNVQYVRVTGISISKPDEVIVSLRYNGNATSPALTVIATVHQGTPMNDIGSMMGYGSGMGMMQNGIGSSMMSGSQPMMTPWNNSPAIANNTQWQQWHTQMAQWHGQINSTEWQQMQAWHNQIMAQMLQIQNTSDQATFPQPQVGSSVVSSGWNDSTIKVRLEGDGSAFESSNIEVMVYPLTS